MDDHRMCINNKWEKPQPHWLKQKENFGRLQLKPQGWSWLCEEPASGAQTGHKDRLCHLSAPLCSPAPTVGFCFGLYVETTAALASHPPWFRTSKSFSRWFKRKPWAWFGLSDPSLDNHCGQGSEMGWSFNGEMKCVHSPLRCGPRRRRWGWGGKPSLKENQRCVVVRMINR